MPRLTADQWADVRAEREAGATFRDLAEKYGVSLGSLSHRARKEKWGDGTDVQKEIRRRAAEKSHGVSDAVRHKKRAEALDRAASRAAEIIEQHKQDWQDHRQRFGAITPDFETGKHAKINAEMLRIRHQGERIAWGLEDANPTPQITIKREW